MGKIYITLYVPTMSHFFAFFLGKKCDNLNSWTVLNISEQILIFCEKFFKILIFGQNFDFLSEFRLSYKISILGQNYGFRTKFRFSVKISIFAQNFYLRKIVIFVKSPKFWWKISSDELIFVQIISELFFKLKSFMKNIFCVPSSVQIVSKFLRERQI